MVKINVRIPLRSTQVDTLRLINKEGQTVARGTIIHVMNGATLGRAYRFEGVVTVSVRSRNHLHGHTHRIKATRKATQGHFRAVEMLAPESIGCRVHVPMSRTERMRLTCCHWVTKIDDYMWAGAFALIPLALFEHFHMSGKIAEVVSLGMLTSGSH